MTYSHGRSGEEGFLVLERGKFSVFQDGQIGRQVKVVGIPVSSELDPQRYNKLEEGSPSPHFLSLSFQVLLLRWEGSLGDSISRCKRPASVRREGRLARNRVALNRQSKLHSGHAQNSTQNRITYGSRFKRTELTEWRRVGEPVARTHFPSSAFCPTLIRSAQRLEQGLPQQLSLQSWFGFCSEDLLLHPLLSSP